MEASWTPEVIGHTVKLVEPWKFQHLSNGNGVGQTKRRHQSLGHFLLLYNDLIIPSEDWNVEQEAGHIKLIR